MIVSIRTIRRSLRSTYWKRYVLWLVLFRLLHGFIAIALGFTVQFFTNSLTTGQFEAPQDVLKRVLLDFLNHGLGAFDRLPLADVVAVLLGFLVFTAIVILLWSEFKRRAVLRAFPPVPTEHKRMADALINVLHGLLNVPPGDILDVTRHDEHLDRVRDEAVTSISSATAFFKLEVEPETIERCFAYLLGLAEAGSPEIRRIVACSTISPKQWLSGPLISYLLTTLGLGATLGKVASHRCRYYQLSAGPDNHDQVILDFLRRVHGIFGFEFRAVTTELDPILAYQRGKGVEKPDPAFLYLEFVDRSPVFYRIGFAQDPRAPFRKRWIEERWVSGNPSVETYRQVIDALCPFPSLGFGPVSPP